MVSPTRIEQSGIELLTRDTLQKLARPYPFAVRRALGLALHLRRGRLDLYMPGGRALRIEGREPGPHAEMIVHDFSFARRLARGGDVGIAEAYLDGHWESPNLARFLELFCSNQQIMSKLMANQPVLRFLQMIRHWMRPNTRSGARRNIEAHYDLGNSFYAAWLDESMTYSSALYVDENADLATAQAAKYHALARSMGLAPGEHVLEIGCGWGGFAEVAARDYGCRVTALTLSPSQHAFASQRMSEAGLSEQVEVKLQDYRDARGTYDRIASIEMVEAVGESFWPHYFRQLRDRLRPSGRIGLQAITIRDDLFENYRRELDFIRAHVFPGGMLPTGAILRDLASRHGLKPVAERIFGLDYARTLAEWRVRFRAAWPALTQTGFDERFRRLWEYYLAYCEAGFRAGSIDVRHMIFAKD